MSEALGNIKGAFCTALLTPHQGLSSTDKRENPLFQKFPSKPGRTSCNFLFPFVHTPLSLADGAGMQKEHGWGG